MDLCCLLSDFNSRIESLAGPLMGDLMRGGGALTGPLMGGGGALTGALTGGGGAFQYKESPDSGSLDCVSLSVSDSLVSEE
mmetsp:Transcript_25937/g.39847  ORF Transcript_25937/g.39847 Transcript_25937/m.39847 type:complete len:81 (-) Transcript_25937:454-696(-)